MACCALAGGFAVAADERPAEAAVGKLSGQTTEEVRDIAYGEVLFDFFQHDFSAAIPKLLLAQQRGRLIHHKEEAELLLGGLYLSYGLHRSAEQIFSHLLTWETAPALRNQAWFYLAKAQFQRGLDIKAQYSLAQIEGHLAKRDLEEERVIMGALLLARAGLYNESLKHLEPLQSKSLWGRYSLYNLAMTMIATERQDQGVALLTSLVKPVGRVLTEEEQALRDKIHVVLGYIYLQQQQYAEAKVQFEEVRLEGPSTQQAFLGLGWARYGLEQPEAALAVWLSLQQRGREEAAVLESYLTVPYLFNQLHAPAQAAGYYETAIAVYDQELQRLDQANDETAFVAYLHELVALNPGVADGAYWRAERLPDSFYSRYFARLFAGHEFQQLLKNYRDLLLIDQGGKQWQGSMSGYDDMLLNRRQAHEARLPRAARAIAPVNIDHLKQRRQAFQQRLEEIEREQDLLALARTDERKQVKLIKSLEQRLYRLKGTPGLEQQAERYRILKGLVLWRIGSDYQPRVWALKKDLAFVERQIAEAEVLRDRIQARVDERIPRFDEQERRLAETRATLTRLQERTASLLRRHERQLYTLMAAELGKTKERLAGYRVNAIFSAAQIYDRAATVAAEGDSDGEG